MGSTTGGPKRAPKGLNARGRAFWRYATTTFEFTEQEVELLIEACRTLDRLDALADAIAEDGPMTDGSKGQRVVHPAFGEARGQAQSLHRLLAALDLPDEDGASLPSARTTRARRAAAARWAGEDTEASRLRSVGRG